MANKNLTEMVFILDRSGSMSGLEADTIGGYNSLLEKQKKEVGDATVTTVLFDDQYEMIHDHAAIGKVKDITNKEYFARGMTGLLQKKISIRYKKSLQKVKENPLSEKFIRRKISLRVKLFVANVVIK